MSGFNQTALDALHSLMAANGIDAVIIPQTDPHHGEYLASHWELRRYISGFTGSAGSLVVTAGRALLWTDSRYFLQAATQLEGSGIELMKDGLIDTPSITAWLCDNLSKGMTVGIDGLLFSINETADMMAHFDAAGIRLDTGFDPADAKVWPDRPELPECKVFIHEQKYAGQATPLKIEAVLGNVRKSGADAAIISALDEVAWILNLRSRDVDYNPVMTAHLYLSTRGGNTLFVNREKLTPEVKAYLDDCKIAVAPYESVIDFLKALPADVKVLVSGAQTGVAIADVLGPRALVGSSVTAMLKTLKNEVEIAGTRAAMHRDGVAMVRALREIKEIIAAGRPLREADVADILVKYRSQGENYVEESFGTIAGFGPNGAIVHYTAHRGSDAAIDSTNLLLIDSGAQYLDGTTDITRTISLGTVTAEQRHDFTLVMKGHIALATAVFPEGTRGHQLDAMARMPLWREGKSYLHGTGHGVGHFLCVHEGPQSFRLNDTGIALMPGMITSNEPGLYLSGRYGIRCENLVLTVPAMETEFGRFFKLETLTLCPFERDLFDKSIMSPEEIAWVDEYHAHVCAELSPLLEGEDKKWLEEATRKL